MVTTSTTRLTLGILVLVAIIGLGCASLYHANAAEPPAAPAATSTIPAPQPGEEALAPEDEQALLKAVETVERARAEQQQAAMKTAYAEQYLRAEMNQLFARRGKNPDVTDIAPRQTGPDGSSQLFYVKKAEPPKRE